MIESRQLKFFITVVEDLHFSRAADRLGVAQSAVSTQIQRLERQVGAKLINRKNRQPVTLTDAGLLFYEEAVAALRHVERAEEVGRLAAQGIYGIVTLGFVASGVTTGIMSQMLGAFRYDHQDVKLNVLAMATPRQLEALASGEIDVGIVRSRRQYASGISASVIHSERLLVAMSDNHPLAGKRNLRAADLGGQTFIVPQFNETEGFSATLARLSAAGGFVISSEYRVNDFISAVSLAAAGYGIVVAPESIRVFHQPGVVCLNIRDFSEEVQLALVYRTREQSRAVKSFIKSALGTISPSRQRG
ncbi:LysR family transcriptional regulator [Paraburkholderia ginsengiterrae]|uniref:LysR family transcriptional regulator n=1 Tax=Paraburkholderia ginsengiterrae TaxID=1462993 RepID=A0A1A9N831_9BURK|nr:LysR family transcriptional regulator [Paraburkholderia ginsengiterrae]OAJ59723.1 LysR family transcriptional regulator [Paraburkholderia ginsengiterrae]OAJ59835.1 LysR family transcriptional regulator [Paraburkholderia ginsengiterrae]